MGWLWYLFYLPNNPANGVEFRTVQYGMSFCISCHASSDRDQGAFAFLGNLEGHDPATYVATTPVITHGSIAQAPNQQGGPHARYASIGALLDNMMYQPIGNPKDEINVDLWRLLRKRAGLLARRRA
jgi:hypothetical protein